MSPRGVATPDAREQLFQAAERVLARDGLEGLTSRAITGEAGVAKGLLFNHFSDLDQFLAELVLDRARATGPLAGELASRAGTRTVQENLVDAAASILRSHAFAVAGIIHARPTLMSRLHQISSGRPYAVLDDVEQRFASYLEAEKALGRLPADTDAATVGFILVGVVHHIFMTDMANSPTLRRRLQRIVSSLI
ncbi:MAG: TetR/AcrR family transcriptional regulator [Acidimicrobiaceae bacterium]|nr:TetR/AcrR family transcriptional regulator [Acidimicrobiaceae bacterium]